MLPAVFGIAGLMLSAAERDFFTAVEPLGFILFARNVRDRQQLRALTDSLREVTRPDVPVLIDQEGGRVARLGPPEWPVYPPAGSLAALWARDPEAAVAAVYCNYEAIGLDLAEVGISVDCAPVLDVPVAGADAVIGDRAFGAATEQSAATVQGAAAEQGAAAQKTATLGRAALDGLAAAGVVGVVKHIPGHGRAGVDSHHQLPVVTASAAELEVDLAPFRALRHAPMAMTAHVVYHAWDPDRCATLSPRVIETVIRGAIGFDGLLFSDDLDMQALEGAIPDRAAAALAAGCDVALNCWARMPDMVAMAERLPAAGQDCLRRLDAALAVCESVVDFATLAERRDHALARRDAALATLA